jgi:molybdenum cofactor cytidylyltransferase
MIGPDRIGVVLLAAGRSLRFGDEDKLCWTWRGKPLVRHAAQAIEQAGFGSRVAVVQSASSGAGQLLGDAFTLVENVRPEAGLSSSLRLGIEAAGALDVDAALVCLGDMPFLKATTLLRICAAADSDEHPVVASFDGSRPSSPALFARSRFDRLLALEGDVGARLLLGEATLVRVDAAELVDIDLKPDRL